MTISVKYECNLKNLNIQFYVILDIPAISYWWWGGVSIPAIAFASKVSFHSLMFLFVYVFAPSQVIRRLKLLSPVDIIWCLGSLQWRHNEHDGISNHQPHDCLLNRLFRHKSKKTSKLRVTGLCAGNSPVTGEFPAQRASNAENVSIWWCYNNHCHLECRLCGLLGVYPLPEPLTIRSFSRLYPRK